MIFSSWWLVSWNIHLQSNFMVIKLEFEKHYYMVWKHCIVNQTTSPSRATYMIKTLINDGINNEMWYTLLCGSFTSVITTFIFLSLHVASKLQENNQARNKNKFENIEGYKFYAFEW